jgi:hypothetical protein
VFHRILVSLEGSSLAKWNDARRELRVKSRPVPSGRQVLDVNGLCRRIASSEILL